MHPYYSELIQTSHLQGASRVRYARWLNLLRRICLDASADFTGDYATLFSRLLAVCHVHQIDHRPADRFRRNARRVLLGEFAPTPEAERADLADLSHFVWQITNEPVPAALPQAIRPVRVKASSQPDRKPCRRGVVSEVTGPHTFDCQIDGIDYPCHVTFREDDDTPEEKRLNTLYFYKGANVMLLDAEAKDGATDTWQVYMAVLEPDYLIDVTSLTATVQPYGTSPLNFLVNQLAPRTTNRYNLLGDMANQFMDDCVNGDGDERGCLRKGFLNHLLDYACLSDDEIPAGFFALAKMQYEHISDAVAHQFSGPDVGITRAKVVLEPAFICPTLGLRGRLDVMTTDHRRVLELKSGKRDEWNNRPQDSHLLQMTLYLEMLRRNFHIQWGELQSYLFYSRYPLFYNERPSAAAIRDVLVVRNGIIRMKHEIRRGNFVRLLPMLTPGALNQNKLRGKFFEDYLRPQIEHVTGPLQKMADNNPLLTSYVSHFMTFVERELFMSKTSDNRPDSIRGFAAAWTADRHTKLLAGNLLTGLTIRKLERDADEHAIEQITFNIPDYGGELIPNFSEGEMVQVYEASDQAASMANRQLIRGTVTELSATTIKLKLAYKQRNPQLFDTKKRYAIEHDATDGPSNQQVRNLFALVTAIDDRRDLLLARRKAQADQSRTLLGNYPEVVSDIVLRAKRAKDLFLLVGPPGTGKTNVALRSMVSEYLLTSRAEGPSYGSLLLTAYTNRAVDEICSMLDNLAKKLSFDYLRIGAEATCAEPYRKHLLSKKGEECKRREDARRLIDSMPIIVGTVLTLTNNQILFKRKRFAAAIIDEASQLLEPQAMGLLCARDGSGQRCAIDKFILIGDHKQLPAVVMLNERQTAVHDRQLIDMGLTNLRNSLFERLHAWLLRTGQSEFVGMLNRQGRMHPSICDFVSRCFYENQLQAVPLEHQREGAPWPEAHPADEWQRFVASTRLGFVDVKPEPHGENLRANAAEADVVGHLIDAIVALHEERSETTLHQWQEKEGTGESQHFASQPVGQHVRRDEATPSDVSARFEPEQAIGVIVPFRSQIAAIRKVLRAKGYDWADRVTIDTVECYQGSQRDYILFSTTISQPYQLALLSSVQRVGGVDVDRKLNVALTRARRQLFVVGNRELLEQSAIYRKLIAYCRKL